MHKLVNIPSTNLYLNQLDSVFSFTEENEMEKEMGGRQTDDGVDK